MALTKAQLAWVNRLSALLADIPAGVELDVRPGLPCSRCSGGGLVTVAMPAHQPNEAAPAA